MHKFSSRLLSDRETIMYSYGRVIPHHLYTFIQWHCFHITVNIVGYPKLPWVFPQVIEGDCEFWISKASQIDDNQQQLAVE